MFVNNHSRRGKIEKENEKEGCKALGASVCGDEEPKKELSQGGGRGNVGLCCLCGRFI
jgi:hypothetical protein